MWSVGSRPRDVYLGTRAIAACRGDEVLLAQQIVGLESALLALRAWLQATPARGDLRLWLSGGLCRPFVFQPTPELKSRGERLVVAAAMAPDRTGLAGPCAVWLDRAKPIDPCIAVALNVSDRDAILGAVVQANPGRNRILSIRPWWGDALRAVLREEPGMSNLAIHDCDSITALSGPGERFDTAITLAPVFDRQSADAALARMRLSGDNGGEEGPVARLMPLPGEQSKPRTDRAWAGVALHPFAELCR